MQRISVPGHGSRHAKVRSPSAIFIWLIPPAQFPPFPLLVYVAIWLSGFSMIFDPHFLFRRRAMGDEKDTKKLLDKVCPCQFVQHERELPCESASEGRNFLRASISLGCTPLGHDYLVPEGTFDLYPCRCLSRRLG